MLIGTVLSAGPAGVRRRYRYDHIFELLKSAQPGQWVAIDPESIAGAHSGSKQSRIIQAAKQRHLHITTVFREPGLICYARLLTEHDNAVPTSRVPPSSEPFDAGEVK
jgi:hypothetical protein